MTQLSKALIRTGPVPVTPIALKSLRGEGEGEGGGDAEDNMMMRYNESSV